VNVSALLHDALEINGFVFVMMPLVESTREFGKVKAVEAAAGLLLGGLLMAAGF
jgi:hypothetical protein